jgi:L-histidine N-alpha-methyltransferase
MSVALAVKPELASLDVAADAKEGLLAHPKRLPPRLFYDAQGSALFEQITTLPEYYPTRTELGLFEAHGAQMLAQAGRALTIVELGAGSGAKTRVLLRALLAQQPRATYVPVDVSRTALEQCARSLEGEFPALEVVPLEGRYRIALPQLSRMSGRKLVLFIGSSIGNFEPAEAVALLRDLREGLRPGDALLLGTDLVKPAEVLEPAYDDAQGVTARFNLNMLARLNRELGANFALERFRHVALWNAQASRIEMHLESTTEQSVHLSALGLDIRLSAGERIHTENAYKFSLGSVASLLDAAGYSLERTWTDPRGWFADHLARVL